VFRKKLWPLLPVPSVLLDLHGMSDYHGVDLVYGTAGGATPAWLLEAALEAAAKWRSASLSAPPMVAMLDMLVHLARFANEHITHNT